MCSYEKKYAITEFEAGLQIVSSCWIDKNKITCWWPSHLTSKTDVTRAVLQTMPQEDKWSKLTIIKIFGSSGNFYMQKYGNIYIYTQQTRIWFTDDYKRALDKLAQAEETSNLEDSDYLNSTNVTILAAARKKRQQRKKKVFNTYDNDDDDDDESNTEQFKTNKKRSVLQGCICDYNIIDFNMAFLNNRL